MLGKLMFTHHYYSKLGETERNGYLVVLVPSTLTPEASAANQDTANISLFHDNKTAQLRSQSKFGNAPLHTCRYVITY
jgi:hypothetical protein